MGLSAADTIRQCLRLGLKDAAAKVAREFKVSGLSPCKRMLECTLQWACGRGCRPAGRSCRGALPASPIQGLHFVRLQLACCACRSRTASSRCCLLRFASLTVNKQRQYWVVPAFACDAMHCAFHRNSAAASCCLLCECPLLFRCWRRSTTGWVSAFVFL